MFSGNFSKFVQLRPLTSKSSTETAYHLFYTLGLQGLPRILLSVNGPEFVARLIKT